MNFSLIRNVVMSLLFIFGLSSSMIGQENICGTIFDAGGNCDGIAGVDIIIRDSQGNIICQTVSGLNGQYCCTLPQNPSGGSVPFSYPLTVCPSAQCYDYSGIKQSDLDLVQNYVLGIPSSYPPDFELWADVNGDGVVDTIDLVILYKIINNRTLAPEEIFNQCRIISEQCRNAWINTDPYNLRLCLLDNGCVTVPNSSPSNGSINFYLYQVGDADTDSDDCIKPLWEPTTTTRKFNSIHLVASKEANQTQLGIENVTAKYALLEFDLPNYLSIEDVEINVPYFYSKGKSGRHNILIYSEKQKATNLDQILTIKQLLNNNELAEIKVEGSILLDNCNTFNLIGISYKGNSKFLYAHQTNRLLFYQDELVTDNCNIMIIDQIGRVLLQKNINLDFGINEIPLENILSSSGIYFAKVSHSNGQNSIQKILYAQP